MKTAEICNRKVLIVEKEDFTYDPTTRGIIYPFSALYHLKSPSIELSSQGANVILFINGDQVSVLKDEDHAAPEILGKKNYTKLLLKAGIES